MTRKRKILTFCATQVALIALTLGFGGNQQAKGPYAKLFQNTFGVKDAEAGVTRCGSVCSDYGPWGLWCSEVLAMRGDWCSVGLQDGWIGCMDGWSQECYDEFDISGGGGGDDSS